MMKRRSFLKALVAGPAAVAAAQLPMPAAIEAARPTTFDDAGDVAFDVVYGPPSANLANISFDQGITVLPFPDYSHHRMPIREKTRMEEVTNFDTPFGIKEYVLRYDEVHE